MNSRRKFMAMSAAATAAILMPVTNAAAEKSRRYPSNVVYTRKDTGVWDKKAATHLPQVEVKNGKAIIRTLHPMTEKHYIVRHTLVDKDGNVVGAKTFSNTDEKAVSRFKIPAGSKGKKFFATSFCNKHDFWVSPVTL
ncbi:desulfoferrodoxin family protein [Desulfovibrio sp. JC010]|uniref:desulfoferrodoxin family protein n=1 Tax=Desulfovibrio sp. JC010 TaxID=2593641 RepID=UPI0013D59D30|nr:desulfoferrodoxin family protein [Desulfovibrio sp. JC010]NDV26830.1 twin-arginine translocation signal domain-containing protein [Desulfovibrio sp. JC010]